LAREGLTLYFNVPIGTVYMGFSPRLSNNSMIFIFHMVFANKLPSIDIISSSYFHIWSVVGRRVERTHTYFNVPIFRWDVFTTFVFYFPLAKSDTIHAIRPDMKGGMGELPPGPVSLHGPDI